MKQLVKHGNEKQKINDSLKSKKRESKIWFETFSYRLC